MGYLKFSATHLFTGREWLGPEKVVIAEGNGSIEGVFDREAAGDDVQELNGILSPGFVNAHVHLELSAMKGLIPPGTGMTAFLASVMRQRSIAPDRIQNAIAEAEAEMLRNGIVAAGDICNTSDTLLQKKKNNLHYHHFIELTGFSPELAPERFERGKQLAAQFRAAVPGRTTLVPHAPYSVSPELFRMIAELDDNPLISIHSQESEAEEAFLKDKSGPLCELFDQLGIDLSFYQPRGEPALPQMLRYFDRNHRILLVHNVHMDAQDIAYNQQHREQLPQIFLCLCPNANLYIGNGLPDVELLMDSGIPIVLGTDSLASNTQLSILAEIKTLSVHLPHVPIQRFFHWATLEGARALQCDALYGSLEKGKKPGLLLCSVGLDRVERLV